jgi:4a-hydroxytetrahydrobiopterin dehydratase
MQRPDLLTDNEIKNELSDSPEWKLESNTINREIVAPNFPAAIGLVNAIAILAEKADHHPDILIYGWNKIRISLSTHDKGGLTKLDFQLAKEIDNLNFSKY